MEIGKYSSKKVDFRTFDVKKFPLTLWDKDLYALAGCGPNLLGLITGIDPYLTKKIHKNITSFSDKIVISFLKKYGFKILPLTQCLMSNNTNDICPAKIKSYNVIICSQLLKKNECSWFCLYGGYYFHNTDINKSDILDFINYPINTAYLITRSDWK